MIQPGHLELVAAQSFLMPKAHSDLPKSKPPPAPVPVPGKHVRTPEWDTAAADARFERMLKRLGLLNEDPPKVERENAPAKLPSQATPRVEHGSNLMNGPLIQRCILAYPVFILRFY